MSIRIDRCLCFARSFAELREVAADTGATTLPELQKHIEFGKKCRLCHPYVRRMLQSGETVFSEILTDQEPTPGI